MKLTLLAIFTVAVLGFTAYLIVGNYKRLDRPARSAFDANEQALSNGLIGTNKVLIPEAEGKAAGLYVAACAFCHDLPDPASHDAVEWEYVVDRMEKLIVEVKGRAKRVNVPFDGGIKKGILAYLEKHAFKGMNPDDLPDTPEKGAKLFKEACATCHTLPNPAMHTLPVWEYVVAKMQHFQKDMGLPVMTEDEAAAVLEYLTPLSR